MAIASLICCSRDKFIGHYPSPESCSSHDLSVLCTENIIFALEMCDTLLEVESVNYTPRPKRNEDEMGR
jgi:hypothetical protein